MNDTGGDAGVPTVPEGVVRVRGSSSRAEPAAVAVCIPVYQGAEHLAETLRSVLAQTRRDLEVVVLDNGSTDGTAAVLAAFDDPRLTVWRSAVTVPMLENFNRVVALSGAPLVKVLPADDLLAPDCLERQVAVMDADPNVAVVVGRCDLVDERSRTLARSRFLRGLLGHRDRVQVLRRVVRSGANPVGGDVAVVFRRRAFDAAGGYRSCESFADIALTLAMLEHGTFVGLAASVAAFRVTPVSRSAAVSARDHLDQRAWTAGLAAGGGVRRRDRWVSRVGAPLARARRELVFALVRRRAAAAARSAPAPAAPVPPVPAAVVAPIPAPAAPAATAATAAPATSGEAARRATELVLPEAR